MKITKVEVFRLPTANSKQNSPIGCRIHTDVGICGDGEAGMAYGVGGSGAFGMDTNRVEARFEDGTTVAIDCIAVEDKYGNTPAQRAELDWLLGNKPLEYTRLVLSGEMEQYLSLGCDHRRLED